MSLTLLESDPETADFGFEARNMADGTNSNAAKLICPAASFDEFASVFIRSSAFLAFFCRLFSGGETVRESCGDAHGQEGQLASGGSGGVARIPHRHTQHSR
ncbi:hypothetical protein AGR2A_Cc70052 [Agrobacterium genomosp. 2 str. CFBP 5494]|uniref:Uncharacterized protein n=1 Tax=Agrobacterium genomosp. 2 str. CFBP 5494 TaxID=1183436 RepID=A0A9W5B278_9HYPH|nr:hypothetical protein AGR2A_Cc70052 [Agrobacterium genomosp. 2 str. CFBP 5494]